MFNPLDPRLFSDPHPLLDALRLADPVHHEPALNLYVVTGYEQAVQVMREPGGDLRYAEFQQFRLPGGVADQPYMRGMREWILMKNGDTHQRIRKVFTRHFTKSRVAALKPKLEQIAHALIDDLAEGRDADLLEAFAKPLPLAVITELLEVPAGDQHAIGGHIEAFKIAVQALPMTDEQLTVANDGISALEAYFTDLITRRRAAPGDDLLSMMVREADAGAFTEPELVANAWGLYAAGHETSSAAICNGVWLLSNNPAELAKLRADWSLLDNAVEEILRLDSPGLATHRLFDHDLRVGGHTIPAGTPVMVYFLAANRDPAHWPCPHAFQVHREHVRDHFGYGHGIHRCLGAHLAHETVAVAMRALFSRLAGLRVDDLTWNQHSIFHGPSRMTVSWSGETDD